MATYEHTALQQYKDQNGDMHLLYPITKAENVDGLYGDAALTGVPTAPTAATGTNTAQVATTAFVQQELEDVKKSVSDGKTAVANAITAKGVTTATDATFDTMAANIGAIESGGGIGLNVFTQETEPETKEGVWVQTANPHQSIVIGDKTYASAGTQEEGWRNISELPYDFCKGSAVVYNGEIHILGHMYSSNNKKHYAFNGSSWREVSTLPYGSSMSGLVVYHNELYLLGGITSTSNYTSFYKFVNNSWVSVGTLPYQFEGEAVVYNNKIHLLGGHANGTKTAKYHRAWDGSSWVNVSSLPYTFYQGSAVVYNDEIHILGSNSATSYTKQHYAFNGKSWRKVSTLPYALTDNHSAVVYNNEIHIFGIGNMASTKHYKFDGNSWSNVDTLPHKFGSGAVVVYEGKIHMLGGDDSSTYKKHYAEYIKPVSSVPCSKIAIYQNPSNTSGTYATNFISGAAITGENNKFPSGFDDVYYIDDSGNVEESPTYYGDGTRWIKFKN